MESKTKSPKVWETFSQSPLSSKVVLLGVMVNRLSGFLQIFIVLFLADRGYTHQDTIIALGIYGAGAVVGALFGGAISQRFGARTTTIISMGSTAVLTAALCYVPGYWLVLIVVALASLSAQLFRPASSALLSSQTPRESQTMIFAIYRLGLNLGATGAPLIGYGLYHLGSESFVWVFWGEAFIAAAYGLLAMLTLPAHVPSPPPEVIDVKKEKFGYSAVLADRRFMFYLFATFCHSAVFVQYITILPLYAADVGIQLIWYTLAIAVNGIIVIAFELSITKFTQNYPKSLMLGLGFALVGVGVACYSLPIGPAALILGTVIWSLGEIISGPAFFAWPASAGAERLKSYYLGSFHFMFSLGIALGPVIGGWLYLQLGSSVWPVIASGSFTAALICWYCVREKTNSAAVTA